MDIIIHSFQRVVRDINTDVFLSTKRNWPPGYVNLTSIWEWYFAAEPWYDNSGNSYDFGFPIRLEIKAPQEPKLHYIYNFYDFTEEQPLITTFDISPCFSSDLKWFAFTLPESAWSVFAADPESFKYLIRKAVAENSGLDFIRITRIRVLKTKTAVAVRLALLPKAPIQGSVAPTSSQVGLDNAITTLSNTIDNKQLQIEVPSGTQTIKLTASAYDSTNANGSATGYNAGAMAAVGVSMVVVGIVLGVLGLLVFNRLRGGTKEAFLPQRFENNVENNS